MSETQPLRTLEYTHADRPPIWRLVFCATVNVPLLIGAAILFRHQISDEFAKPLATLLFGIPLFLAQLLIGFGLGFSIMSNHWRRFPRTLNAFVIAIPALSILIQLAGAILSFVVPGTRGSFI